MESYEIDDAFVANVQKNGTKAVDANYTLGGHKLECYTIEIDDAEVEMLEYDDYNSDVHEYAIVPDGTWLELYEIAHAAAFRPGGDGMSGKVEAALRWLDGEWGDGKNRFDWVDENGDSSDDEDEDD